MTQAATLTARWWLARPVVLAPAPGPATRAPAPADPSSPAPALRLWLVAPAVLVVACVAAGIAVGQALASSIGTPSPAATAQEATAAAPTGGAEASAGPVVATPQPEPAAAPIDPAGAAALPASLYGGATPRAGERYTDNLPDPHVLRVGSVYYAYGTQTGWVNIGVVRSDNAYDWYGVGDALPDVGAWAETGYTWAPAAARTPDGRFALYYAARQKATGKHAVGVAFADTPEGPFEPLAEPIVVNDASGGVIDPFVYEEGGHRYLLWKTEGIIGGEATKLFSAELADDGVTLLSEPAELLHRSEGWEFPIIENPAFVRSEGQLLLFYSAGNWASADYSIGVATCETVFGPCQRVGGGPVLAARDGWSGPGGATPFTGPNGSTLLVFHAWKDGVVGYENGGVRSLHIADLARS